MTSEFANQVFGMALLFGSMAGGYWLTVRRVGGALDVQGRIAIVLILGIAGGGFWGALAWWSGFEGAFAWKLPALAGRMLAAAGVAFALCCVLVLRRPHAAHMRLIFVLVLVYLLPLVVAIPLFHLRQFNFAAPVTYGFFIIVFTLTIGSAWFLVRPIGLLATPDDQTISGQMLLWGMAILAGGWALVLFTGMRLPLLGAEFSVYDLLTSRLMAVMSLSVCAAAVFSIYVPSVSKTALSFMLAYGVGAMAAGFSGIAYGQRIPWSYVGIWGCVAIVALGLLVVRRVRARAA